MIPIRFSEIILNRILRNIPPLPWVLHSGMANRILVETKGAYNFAIQQGIPSTQLLLTGSIYLDEMNSLVKKSVKDIQLLVAVAPDMFSSRLQHDLEFESYEEYLEYLCKTLKKYDFTAAIFSMHPSDSGQFNKLIEDYGFSISSEEIHKLLPRSKIFVATVSATIQWASYLQVPTVNFDFYHYDYPDYLNNQDYPLVSLVSRKRDFEIILKGMQSGALSEPGYNALYAGFELDEVNPHLNAIICEILLQIERIK